MTVHLVLFGRLRAYSREPNFEGIRFNTPDGNIVGVTSSLDTLSEI